MASCGNFGSPNRGPHRSRGIRISPVAVLDHDGPHPASRFARQLIIQEAGIITLIERGAVLSFGRRSYDDGRPLQGRHAPDRQRVRSA